MTYLMESSSEGTRLRQKTDSARVLEELIATGLETGAVALDAGCASGAVTDVMAARVGPRGLVYGIDLSQARLAQARAQGAANTRFLRSDLARLPLADACVDYALCRLVLEYVPEPMPLVAELLRVTRPGGRVVLVDVDGYGAFHYPLTEERRAAIETIAGLLSKAGFDAYSGRKLFHYLQKAGATDLEVQLRPYHLTAGLPDQALVANWTYKLETLARFGHRALGRDEYDRCAAALLELLQDPSVLSYSTLFLVSGRRV